MTTKLSEPQTPLHQVMDLLRYKKLNDKIILLKYSFEKIKIIRN